jgi:predicted ATP-dependent serine protease
MAATLTGRDTELRMLERLLDEATGRAVLLRGDPGIGKVRLLDAARELARERGRQLLDTVGVELAAAALLHATSLSIPVVAGKIGVELGVIRPENYVALVAAGLLSVVVFPPLAAPGLSASLDAIHR